MAHLLRAPVWSASNRRRRHDGRYQHVRRRSSPVAGSPAAGLIPAIAAGESAGISGRLESAPGLVKDRHLVEDDRQIFDVRPIRHLLVGVESAPPSAGLPGARRSVRRGCCRRASSTSMAPAPDRQLAVPAIPSADPPVLLATTSGHPHIISRYDIQIVKRVQFRVQMEIHRPSQS